MQTYIDMYIFAKQKRNFFVWNLKKTEIKTEILMKIDRLVQYLIKCQIIWN